ncbi:MAG: hypothetical protein AB1706_10275 [Pseudomonadota bacterium]
MLPATKENMISDVNVMTAELYELIHDLPTGDDFSPEFKENLLKMFHEVAIGEMFYINLEWMLISPAKVDYARRLMKYIKIGIAYELAKDITKAVLKKTVEHELNESTYVEELEEEDYETKFQRLLYNHEVALAGGC